MLINMTIERLLEDGSKLENYTTTHHGWASVKAGTDGLCARYGKRVMRLPNGCEDKAPNPATGVRDRVTFSEIAETGDANALGHVPTTCIEHAYGTTQRLSFQIKVF